MLYYCTNTNDIDRRHIWAVPVAGGTPQQITAGDGMENVPVPLASGKQIAVLSADAKRPMGVALWPTSATPASVGGKAQKRAVSVTDRLSAATRWWCRRT